MKFQIGRYIFTVNFRVTKLQNPVIGLNSNLNRYSVYDKRNRHIPMLDCDDIPKKELIKNIIRLQKKFRLGDAKVLKSSIQKILKIDIDKKFPLFHIGFEKKFKYHIYFTQDSLGYFECLPIVHYSKADKQFKKWRMLRDKMTLRYSPKERGFIPEPDFIIKSPFSKPETGFEKKILFALNEEEIMIKKFNGGEICPEE